MSRPDPEGRPQTPESRPTQTIFSIFPPRPGGGARKMIGRRSSFLPPRVPPGHGGKTDEPSRDARFRWRWAALRASPCHRLISSGSSGASLTRLRRAHRFCRFTDSPIHRFTVGSCGRGRPCSGRFAVASCGRGRPRSEILCDSGPPRALRELPDSITITITITIDDYDRSDCSRFAVSCSLFPWIFDSSHDLLDH